MKKFYIGEYSTSIGEKNRLAVPKKLRKDLGQDIVLARGYENCVIVVDLNSWHSLIDEINRGPLLQLNVRDTKRFLLGGAFELELDTQGRFVLPEALIKYSGIEQQVAFIGVGEWIEIWPQQAWERKLQFLSENSADLADRLSVQISSH